MDDKLLQFVIKLGKKEYDIDLSDILSIDEDNINHELTKQPAKYAWFAVLLEMCKRQEDKMKRLLVKTYAELDKKHRIKMQGRTTERRVEKAIESDSKYTKVQDRLARAKFQTGLMQSACTALLQRKDILLTLNVNIRKQQEQS